MTADDLDGGVDRADVVGRADDHEVETVKSGYEVQIVCPEYGEMPRDDTTLRISSLDVIHSDISSCPICGKSLHQDMNTWAGGQNV